jgi:sugar/nucleoside kinase (ribokinase family)
VFKGDELATSSIVGFGSAIVDLLISVSDAFLSELPVRKGVMSLVESSAIDKILAISDSTPEKRGGGSIANALVCAASLGTESLFVTAVGNDELGAFYEEDLSRMDVSLAVPERDFSGGTGRCLVMVTPDAERTMLTYLGASSELALDDFPLNIVVGAGLLLLEGYLLDNPAIAGGLAQVARTVRKYGTKVVFLLSDANLVLRHLDTIRSAILSSIDLVVCNEAELSALSSGKRVTDGIEYLKSFGLSGAVTLGAKGSFVFDPQTVARIDPVSIAPAVDTTGAGDAYAGAIAAGIAAGLDLAHAGSIASIAAGEVVTHFGARPSMPLDQLVASYGKGF